MCPAPVRLRADFDARTLRYLASSVRGNAYRNRLRAIAAIYEGESRSNAADIAGVTLQAIRAWVIRFNKGGPEALRNHYPTLALRCLTDDGAAGSRRNPDATLTGARAGSREPVHQED